MTERFAGVGGGITLCYERFGDPEDPPILLVMGLATQMIAWHEDFCEELAGRGFSVVRFDNRDIGRSTHVDARPPSTRDLVTRRVPPGSYSLSEMARDAAGLMRELDIAPAHVVGASMGGMIAQTLAAEHPELVRSLTSLMASTGNRWRGQPALSVYRHLLGARPTDREAVIERASRIFGIVGSKGLHDDSQIREMAARSFDRGHDPRGPARQLAAIIGSGDRTEELRSIEAPTLVIHGKNDKLVRPSGGRATAGAIPGARLMLVERMGHDLPRPLWPRLIEAIAGHCRAADRQQASTAASSASRPGAAGSNASAGDAKQTQGYS